MTHYLVQPRDGKFIKGYGFLSFAKNMGRNVARNISKNLSSKNSQKVIDQANQSDTDAFKTASKRTIQKQQKELVICLVIKSLTELRKFQKLHQRKFRNK